MNKFTAGLLVALSLILTLKTADAADALKVAAVFSDHMVLQREMPVPIWGEARPGEVITVKFRQQTKTTQADPHGHWLVRLDPLTAGGPDKLVVSGGQTVEFNDVLVGEVWLGSGQSNMSMPCLNFSPNDPELAKLVVGPPNLQVRLLTPDQWQVAKPPYPNGFSALMYAFGMQLQKELNVPVGLMVGAVSGTPSGSWISEDAFRHDVTCQAALQKSGIASNAVHTGSLYGKHIRPLIPFAIRGVLWDQGESGTAVTGVDQYTLIGALFRGWRQDWAEGEFPFIYMEKPSGQGCAWDDSNAVTRLGVAFQPLLPKVVPADGEPAEMSIRIMNYPNVAMAITSDLGSGLHPVNKYGYAHRAVDVALGMVYGRKIEYYGPLYESQKTEGNKVRVTFTHTGKGLAFKHGDKLQGFAVAGADRKYYWADAVIDGNTVVLSSQQVPQPVAVRYAWSLWWNWANLFNRDGLPAIPFRTDQW